MNNGWGPVERDRSNGQNGAEDGRTLTLNGTRYTKGLGVHAYSEVRFVLGGQCSTFEAKVGVDDEVGSLGSVVFRVVVDGAERYTSRVMTGTAASEPVLVSVAGANVLALVVTDAGDGPAPRRLGRRSTALWDHIGPSWHICALTAGIRNQESGIRNQRQYPRCTSRASLESSGPMTVTGSAAFASRSRHGTRKLPPASCARSSAASA